jgi:hypothetical protein
VLVHVGPVQGLVEANATLQRWAEQRGVQFEVTQEGRASVWSARTETLLSDSQSEPNPSRQQTEIAYLVA